MDFLTLNGIIQIILLSIVFLLSIGFHEYAHAYVSSILGDPTPKMQGRLTPNPLKHIDPIGFLMIFFIHFGWGKAVQVDPSYYKDPLKDELLVSLAGPFANFLMAFVGAFMFVALVKFGQSNYLIEQFFQLFIIINIALGVFNLLPIYPLDGYRIVKFLKPSWAQYMEQHSFMFTIIMLLIVFLPGNPIGTIIMDVITPVYSLFMFIAQSLIF